MRYYLKRLRKAKGLSQKDIAKALGLKQSTYDNIENGEQQKNIKLSTLEKLADALNIPLNALISKELSYGTNIRIDKNKK